MRIGPRATRQIIAVGLDSLQTATEKVSKECEHQIAGAQACGVLAVAAALADIADAIRETP